MKGKGRGWCKGRASEMDVGGIAAVPEGLAGYGVRVGKLKRGSMGGAACLEASPFVSPYRCRIELTYLRRSRHVSTPPGKRVTRTGPLPPHIARQEGEQGGAGGGAACPEAAAIVSPYRCPIELTNLRRSACVNIFLHGKTRNNHRNLFALSVVMCVLKPFVQCQHRREKG